MMLRPATPLTVLLFAAFALLLISVLSTPIIKAIPLASFGGVDFGVFGYCQGNTCTGIEIGYNTGNLFSGTQAASFDLPISTRTTLSAILIIHPIAALFTLIMLVLAGAAHLHSPSHSPRYLLGVFILSILTLILALLAFLIDVLLFVPHMAWGSYLVLAATILIAASGIVSCAMRRTLVSRKARKRRIAENAEMNGENFYNRQGPDPVAQAAGSTILVSGGSGVDKLASFATFETAKPDPERQSDERIPLTSRSDASATNGQGPPGMGTNDRYGIPPRMGNSPTTEPFRDQYGNPMPPPPGPYGARSRDPSADPSLNRQYSANSMNSRGRGGMPPPGGYRGRGGYGPPGRGGFGQPRGGYGPPGRGGYGPPRGGYGGQYRGGMNDGMRGGRGAPPPGYGPPRNGPGYDNRGPAPIRSYSRMSPPQQPGPGYGRDPYGPPPVGEYAAYTADEDRSSLPRAEPPPPLPGLDSDGPVGQAIEMDATTGSPSVTPHGFGQFGNIRESDDDVAGMVGLQQQRLQRETLQSETSHYSNDEPYVPPRQAWGEAGRSSSLNPVGQAVELPSPSDQNHKRQNSGDNYYEDVDPRFAEPVQAAPAAAISSALSAGYPPNQSLRPIQTSVGLDGNRSYEDLQSGARSPAESDRSNFTSVSQRGVNPRWNGGPGYAPMPTRRPGAPQNDILFNSNPDFQLPGNRGGRGGPSRGGGMRGGMPGMVPSSAYPGGTAL